MSPGLRQVVAAVWFRFCAWRAGTAADRHWAWEDRARRARQWGEPPDDPDDDQSAAPRPLDASVRTEPIL